MMTQLTCTTTVTYLILLLAGLGEVSAKPATARTKRSIGVPLTAEEFAQAALLTDKELRVDSAALEELYNGPHFEGDIDNGQPESTFKNAINNVHAYWPNAVVPYAIDATLSDQKRRYVANAITAFHRLTCVHFVDYDPAVHNHYVRISGSGNRCWAQIGRNRWSKVTRLYLGCDGSITVHEIMHTLGFWHEHNRPDRDSYIDVHWNQIPVEYYKNYKKNNATKVNTFGMAYDFFSVMHYPIGRKISIKPGMEPRSYPQQIGHQQLLTELDAQKINQIYRCNGRVIDPTGTDIPMPVRPTKAPKCEDRYGQDCVEWAKRGECRSNPAFMTTQCRKICGICRPL